MHSIERYGIVALLFLVVTVIAVLMWDGGKEKKEADLVGAASAPVPVAPVLDEPDDSARRLKLLAESQPGPLQRKARARAEELPLAEQGSSEAPAALSADPLPGSEALSAGTEPAAGAPEGAPQTPREQPAPEQVVGERTDGATHPYSIRQGDTLGAIAQRELGSARRWQDIVAANPGLDPAKLRVGKTIQIPGARGAAPASADKAPLAKAVPAAGPAKSASNAAPAGGRTSWKVGKGENLWKIAAQTLGDGKRWREIAALNPGVNPDKLVAGQVLKLPGGAAKSSPKAESKVASAPPSTKAQGTKPKPKPATTLVASNARSSRSGGKVK